VSGDLPGGLARPLGGLDGVVLTGADPALPTPWPIGTAAAVALAHVGRAAARMSVLGGGQPGAVRVDVTAAATSLISFAVQRLDGQPTLRTNDGNPLVDRYRCADGRWIHLHGGFPGLADRLRAELGLGAAPTAEEVAAACAGRGSSELEDAVAVRGGAAAIVRSAPEWAAHPHGSVVRALPPTRTRTTGSTTPDRGGWAPDPVRPLAGLRVLDLTRVLAGPTCGRTLAALGADVLHVRAAHLPNVPAFVIDTGHGKRQAGCDLRDPDQAAALRAVARRAHVVVQGYRPGVMARFGLDADGLRTDGWSGTFASISCYGPDGPWAGRAGWEQLAQSASGLAELVGDGPPRLLPAAATDYTTGYLAGAAVVDAVADALGDGRGRDVEASLCQTAGWLLDAGPVCDPTAATGIGAPTLAAVDTAWGRLEHLPPAVAVDGLHVGWDRPPAPVGAGPLRWA